MVICVFQPQHLVKRVIAEAKGVSDVLHYSPNIVDLTVQLIELKRELFYFSPSNYIAQFVEVRDAELAKQSDNLFKGGCPLNASIIRLNWIWRAFLST